MSRKERPEELSDDQLVETAKSAPPGDMRAFEQLVERYQRSVHTNCRYLGGSESDAEDLAQEVFIKAFFGLQRFEGRAQFKTWLQRIKVNHCLNHLRKKEGKTFVSVDEPGLQSAQELQVAPEAPRAIHSENQRRTIDLVLDSMTDTLRAPLLMRDLDGLSYQEIADLLGIGLSAVKMRIKRAREEFRARYETLTEAPETGGTR